MTNIVTRYASRSIVRLAMTAGLMLSGAAHAQLATNNLVTAPANQSIAGVTVGNGVRQGEPVVSAPAKGAPKIGVGALSGSPDHYGSQASISVANSDRLVGVDGAGGRGSANSVSVDNSRNAPVLSPN